MSRQPFAAIEVLLIDGNNLLHRMSGTADAGALRLLLPGLRAALPAGVNAVLMLDGHAASGTSRHERLAPNLELRHAGSITADDALLEIVRQETVFARAAIVVVSDDRALADRARSLGARTRRLTWLEELIARPRGGQPRRASIGNRRPRGSQPTGRGPA